jgi:hypothetical protein
VTASEFAFLALGLVLGVAAGAALVEIARSRPSSPREVRITVAPNSIRSRASTLADGRQITGEDGPARGGPADRRWVDRDDDEPPDSPDDPPAGGSASPSGPASRQADEPAPPNEPAEHSSATRTPVSFGLRPAIAGPGGSFLAPPSQVAGGSLAGLGRAQVGSGRPSVGIPISREADPMMAALLGSASADATVQSEPDDSPEDGVFAAMASAAGRKTGAATKAGAATITKPASPTETTTDGGRGRGVSADAGGGSPTALAKRGGAGAGPSDAPAASPAAKSSGGDDSGAIDSGPCADQRRVADERCAVATRARDGARRAAEAHRTAQRDYDDNVGHAETAASVADPRSVRTAKEAAQHAFRAARAGAATRDAIETAARDWLTEINRINLATRESVASAERHRVAAAELAPSLERLAVEADAARISAESAEEACVAAREAVATCEEAAAAAAAAAVIRNARPSVAERSGQTEPGTEIAAANAAADSDGFEDDDAMGSRAGEDAAIIRLLRGDREIMPRIVAHLGGDDPDEQRRWRLLLTGLVEALVARSIEAASFDFPADHSFWGPFTRAQSRDIAAALASLGYRHDGFGGWADERVPSQRDLSLAVGYAGLDPMRTRHWPTESEMVELLRDVTVAADEYIWEAAGSLTLGELVSLLGRRADGLTDLWNDWGSVRPLLLSGD